MRRGQMASSKPNVVLFGETGSGKSSTVNLLLGEKRAEVSDSAVGCTFEFAKHELPSYNLYDTCGLSEGSTGTVNQNEAIKSLARLLMSLESGVSLLIFVAKQGRITETLVKNYKLFVDAICMKNVPVLLLLTHTEMLDDPDQWWLANRAGFDRQGLTFNAAILGCCKDPEKAPAAFREHFRKLTTETGTKLSCLITATMLVPGWRVEGGWKTWLVQVIHIVSQILYSIVTGIGRALTFGLWKPDPLPEPQHPLAFRLANYFRNNGYDDDTARAMGRDIAAIVESA